MQSLIEQIGVDDFPVEGKETTCFLGIPGDLVAGLWLEGLGVNGSGPTRKTSSSAFKFQFGATSCFTK